TIDPVTGKEVKGKERMVFNYKSLNDNTYKERIGGAKIFSKFDLKLGFHQVAIDKESIPWTAFLIPGGLYEWLVMPFGHFMKKTNAHGDKRMKSSDYELVRKIKEQVQNLPDLEIPPENAYIILETDGCMEGWGGIVKWKKSKEDPRGSERIYAYASGKFSTTQSTIDAEINACINTLEKLKIYYLHKQEVTFRTDCQAIISFYNKTNSNKPSRVRMHIRNEGISNSSSSLSGENSTQKKQLKLCETYKQSYNAKPKYALDDQPKTTTGQIKEKTFESKIRKPEESSSNWKPWHKDWDATTSNFPEDDVSNDDNKYRYNRKGFLEDDDARSDDSIFIVDP
nr:putative polyprotein [Tanacetum cinerariifolium]